MLVLFLNIVAPPVDIATLSAICVNVKPYLSKTLIKAWVLFLAPLTAAAISASLISPFKPDLRCFNLSELNNLTTSFQN